ncbi:hypothetical protein ACFQ6B_23670 [Streptomyces wedmorensis]|uniref:Uncharacterized protein n=1 Tax=Streptomyces wedmorensis TaxID=43759 RepID=A0ABW6J6G7_STRWE
MDTNDRRTGRTNAAAQAAADLLADGHHVHYASHAEQICLNGECSPFPAALHGTTTQERP